MHLKDDYQGIVKEIEFKILPMVTYHGLRNPVNKQLKCRGSRCYKADWHLAIANKKNK